MYNTVDQIDSFLNKRSTLGVKPGLDRMETMLLNMDNPEKRLFAVHVAGTNGKGSSTAFLSQALVQNGYHVGVFTSPSFAGLKGHIILNGSIISNDDFVGVFSQLLPTINDLDKEGAPPTTFEIITVMALIYFADHADIALIEAGMGGREDATNVIHPLISIITNVAYDHTAFLGSTIEAIAYHKAGIIKPNTPVITGQLNKDAESVVRLEAKQKRASVHQLGRSFTYTQDEAGKMDHYHFETRNETCQVSLSMKGIHQIHNSALSIMALVLLNKRGFPIDWENALEGVSQTQLPGRYERVHCTPRIVVDGAHNPAGMKAFLQTVDSDAKLSDKYLLFAAFRDKDIQTMLSMAVPVFNKIVLTTFDHPRAANRQDFEELEVNEETYSFAPSWEQILSDIAQRGEIGRDYYVAGSLHFIEQVRNHFLFHENG